MSGQGVSTPFRPGAVVWYRGRRGRLIGYRDERRAVVRFDGAGVDSVVAGAKLAGDRRESVGLALDQTW
jgi:hypothetical protein